MVDEQVWTKHVVVGDKPVTIRLSWEVVDASPEITSVTVQAETAVTAGMFRLIQFGALFEECRWDVGRDLQRETKLMTFMLPTLSPHRQARQYDDEHYRRIALHYMSTADISNKPVKRLAEMHDVSSETVRRWLKEARNRGLLTSEAPDRD